MDRYEWIDNAALRPRRCVALSAAGMHPDIGHDVQVFDRLFWPDDPAAAEILRLAERERKLREALGEARAGLLVGGDCFCDGGFTCSRCKALAAVESALLKE
jgi:hypothetical protein